MCRMLGRATTFCRLLSIDGESSRVMKAEFGVFIEDCFSWFLHCTSTPISDDLYTRFSGHKQYFLRLLYTAPEQLTTVNYLYKFYDYDSRFSSPRILRS